MTQPAAAKQDAKGDRWYKIPGYDEPMLSVTSIIDIVVSKPVLVPWAVKLTANYMEAHPGCDIKEAKRQHKYVKEASAARGDRIHNWAERYILDPQGALAEPLEDPDEARACLGLVEALTLHRVEPIAVESTVFNPELGYAGTADLFAVINGVPSVADYKTGNSTTWAEISLQMAAYAWAPKMLLPNGEIIDTPDVEQAVVIHVEPTETKLYRRVVDTEEFEAFRCGIVLAKKLLAMAKDKNLHVELEPPF